LTTMTFGTSAVAVVFARIGPVPDRVRFRAGALVAWLAVALTSPLSIWTGQLSGWRAIGWVAAFLLFTAAYAASLRWVFSAPRRASIALLIVEVLAGFTMVLTTIGMASYTSAVAFILIADQVPYLFSPRISWLWAAGQSAALALLFGWFDGWVGAVSGGGAFAGFHLLVASRALFERSERAAHRDLARANAELLATRELLAETSRTAERLRIARDLHDTLGHHLTALSIRLEVASRVATEPTARHLSEAHAIAKLLLSDVRDVVGRFRGGGSIDLAKALRLVTSTVDRPAVHLDAPEPLPIEDPARAEVLLRCVQEAVTNAMRHGHAENLWVDIVARDGGIELHVSDDGRGAVAITRGHGLRGMQERFDAYSGSIDFIGRAGHGFEIRAFMPLAGDIR